MSTEEAKAYLALLEKQSSGDDEEFDIAYAEPAVMKEEP